MKKPRTGRRATLITGASSGIGEAFASALAATDDLLLCGRDPDALEALRQRLASEGGRVETVSADLATPPGLDSVSQAGLAFGTELFVCNAGLGPFGDFLDADEESLHDTVAVNVMAPVVLLRRLLPAMLARAADTGTRAGLIVTSSNTAFLPVPRLATYAASKAFDLSLTEALAAELAGRPIDVLALCPTATRSRFASRAGFSGGTLPGSQSPDRVARAALAALGRQRTLVLGAVSGGLLSGPALIRYTAARALAMVMPRS